MNNRRNRNYSLSIGIILALTAVSVVTALGQGRYANTYAKSQVGAFVANLERSSNVFRRQFDRAMDRSNIDGTADEDRYNRLVVNYESSLNDLRRQFNRNRLWWDTRNEVDRMIGQARPVNDMMINLPFGRNLETQWSAMRNDINKLADTYDLQGLNGGGFGGGTWNPGNDGGWVGGGSMSAPPAWAQGTFYSSNVSGYTMVIDRTGRVTLQGPDRTSYGRWYQNTIYVNNDAYPATRSGNGMRAYDRSTGRYTDYSRTGFGGGNPGGGWDNSGGSSSTPPNWAQGTFYSENIPGYTMTINRNGQVTLYGPNQSSTGRYYQGSVYINNAVYPISQISNGVSARDQSTGTTTIYRRR